ncbi:cytochrome c-type biogenesis protein [Amorphus sp. MBR-141]
MTRLARLVWVVVFAIGLALPALAVQPDEVLDDPALEARARDLSAELRCMVCQNESIDASNAPLARDIRLLLRERLEEGDSDREVLDYLVSRYGEFVLLKPRLSAHTLLLWLTPLLVLLAGGWMVVGGLRRRRQPEPAPLSATEEAELRRVLSDDARR